MPASPRAGNGAGPSPLRALRQSLSAGAATWGDLLHVGGGSAGMVLLALGLVTLIPGIGTLCGAALAAVALPLLAGHGRPWLPDWLRHRPLPAGGAALSPRVAALLDRVEARLRPRLPHLVRGVALRAVGLAVLVDGILILLPVPLGNMAPALAVLVLALGLLAGDGAAVLAGLAATIAALLFDAVMIGLGYEAVLALLNGLWGTAA